MSVVRLRFLFSLLALLALLAAPLGMRGGAAMAMPHDSAAAAGHCDGMTPNQESGDTASVNCVMACAALPAVAPDSPAEVALAADTPAAALLVSLHGMRPEAATPPPRKS